MARFLRPKRLLREFLTLTLAIIVSLVALNYFWPPQPLKAGVAAVAESGIVFIGDLSTTTQGGTRAREFTSTSTWGSQFETSAASGTQYPLWIIAKTAPTREEILLGTLKQNGTLDIQYCNSGCDASGDFTATWNNPDTTATQDCDGTPTAGTCIRAFDIGYEALSGKGFVVYSDNTADKAYYARWDGSAWSPDSSPETPSATNEIDLPLTAGTPRWIRVIPNGQGLDENRTNRVMVLISDTNSDLHAFYWNGSSFDSGTTISSDLATENDDAQNFDGAWESPTEFVAAYGNGTTAEIRYNTYTVGTGWGGSDSQAFTTVDDAIWVQMIDDPTSTRILLAAINGLVGTNGEHTFAVWRGDNSTDGWTECAVGATCPDTTIESIGGQHAFSAFERFSGQGLEVYSDAGTAINADDYTTYTPTSTFSSATTIFTGGTDDALFVKVWGHPNADDALAIAGDIDCQIGGTLWTGAAWTGSTTQLAADTDTAGAPYGLSNYGVDAGATDCVANTTPQAPPEGTAMPFDFTWKMYTPWQRNWRFYQGSDTTNTPTNALANENTTPTGFSATGAARLRINYADRGNAFNSTDERKKLQYTSGCNPNTSLEVTCTWTDVDDPAGAGIWRYKDCDTGDTDCDDGVEITGTVLTGSGTCAAGTGDGCGTFVLDKDAAVDLDMDHNANIVQESEWPIEANGATAGTTYYFRIYNVLISADGQNTPIYREQDADDCGAGSAQCTYPSLTTASAGPTTDDLLRHGNWFSSGVEQSFFWAD